MLENIPILSLIAFSPLIGILVIMFMPKDKSRGIKMVGVAATIIPLILSVWLYVSFNSINGKAFEENVTWINIPLNGEFLRGASSSFQLNYHMAIDGISLLLVVLTAIVAVAAALASYHIKKRWKTYFILFLLLEIGMFGVFMARDLFLFFFFFEATLVTTFFLIGIWGYLKREKAANKFLLYNGLGSAVMLIAFILLVATAGFRMDDQTVPGQVSYIFSGDLTTLTANMQDDQAMMNIAPDVAPGNPFYMTEGMSLTLFILLLVAFGIKLPIFPFHTWMLRVHNEAPPSIVMIHSGILLKMGAYGLIRFAVFLFPQHVHSWAVALAILGVINILYGAVLAFVQKEFKLVLAYSSISHMGIVLLGIASLNEVGLQGALFQMVSHGFISALFFLIVGSLYERTETTRIDELGGLAKSVPFMSGILLIAGLASLGLPGLSGFIGEFLSFLGLFGSMKIITAVGALGIILGAVYVLRGVLAITYGPMSERYTGIKDARLIEAIPMVALVAFIILLGVYPATVVEPLQHSFDQFLQSILKVGG